MSNYLPDDGTKPYLSADEVRAVRIDETKKSGLNPAQVAEALARCAVTIEVLTESLDQLHSEHLNLLADQTTSNASAQATKLLEAATKTCDDLVAQAQAEAEHLMAEASGRRAQADQDFVDYSVAIADRRRAMLEELDVAVAQARETHDATLSELAQQRTAVEDAIARRQQDADAAHASDVAAKEDEAAQMQKILDEWRERFNVARNQFDQEIAATLATVDGKLQALSPAAPDVEPAVEVPVGDVSYEVETADRDGSWSTVSADTANPFGGTAQ